MLRGPGVLRTIKISVIMSCDFFSYIALIDFVILPIRIVRKVLPNMVLLDHMCFSSGPVSKVLFKLL